ncbi:MAG TPA: LysR family transcriptional regulator [Limnochordia bacterium]
MNLPQLQAFVALAETASFTEAAEALHLTQSGVSRALASLERELGVKLIERNRKGVIGLTTAGRQILRHARALLAQAEAIEQEARAAQGSTSGKLRLGIIQAFIPADVVAGVLTRFQRLYPDVSPVLFEGALNEVGEWLETGVVDVGFVLLPAPGTASAPIASDELCVVVPSGHRLCGRAGVVPRELHGEGLIMEKTHCALQVLERAGFELSKSETLIRHQARDSATILAMVQEGLGITLMPRKMLREPLKGVALLPLDPPHRLQIGVAVKSYDTASRTARLFLETAVAWSRTLSTGDPVAEWI